MKSLLSKERKMVNKFERFLLNVMGKVILISLPVDLDLSASAVLRVDSIELGAFIDCFSVNFPSLKLDLVRTAP